MTVAGALETFGSTWLAGPNALNGAGGFFMNVSQTQQDIISFMFIRDPSGAPDAVACLKLWFGKDNETDATIRERFGALVERAMAGEFDSWMQTPRARLR